MLAPRDFLERWNAEVVASHPDIDDFRLLRAPKSIRDYPLPACAAMFLTEAGLPEGCAPFLSFRAVAKGALPLPDYYRLQSADHLSRFHVIGADGAGNPLCIDAAAGGVVSMLDHEDRFLTATFVASSVASLAEALLLLHTLPRKDFLTALERCDPPAAKPDALFPQEF